MKILDLIPRAKVTGTFDTGICGPWLHTPTPQAQVNGAPPSCPTHLRLWKRPSWLRI